MTNINSPVVGLMTRSLGYGVCNPDSIAVDGSHDTKQCKIFFAKRHEFWAQQQPKYFFYFKDARLFPGFADCLPGGTVYGDLRGMENCMNVLYDRLHNNYPLIYENGMMWVFDLKQNAKKHN